MNASTHEFEGTAGYRVIPMNPAVESGVSVLRRAFSKGLTAQRDPGRKDFYSVEIDGMSYYFHVYPARRTAYLLSAKLAHDLGLASTPAHAVAGCHAC